MVKKNLKLLQVAIPIILIQFVVIPSPVLFHWTTHTRSQGATLCPVKFTLISRNLRLTYIKSLVDLSFHYRIPKEYVSHLYPEP